MPRPRTGIFRLLIGDWLHFQLLLALMLIAATAWFGATRASPYDIQIMTLTVIFAIMAVGWTIAAGFAGQLLVGYISFFGIGAYANAILYTKFGFLPWFNLGIGAACGAAFAFAAAAVTVRFGLNQDYFGLFTVALSQVLKVLFVNWALAGKATGISISVLHYDLATMSFPDKTPYLYVGLGLLVLTLLIAYAILRSRVGHFLAAIRESPTAAEALGVDVTRYRILAIAVSGAIAGYAGAFFAQFTTFIDPDKVFGLALNFEFLLGPVLGGRLTLIGPVLGAALLRPAKDILRGWLGGQADALYLVLYGLVLIISILLIPRGIAGFLQRFHQRFLARHD
ncbi:MAG: branched-chain amino acid ABC transporter permease [Gammaproteobacteria bacterium]